MKRVREFLLYAFFVVVVWCTAFGAVLLAGGCSWRARAVTYKATFEAAAVTRAYVDEEYARYSQRLNERLDVCEMRLDEHEDLEALDDCMGPGFTYDESREVQARLAVYRAAAASLSALMSRPVDRDERVDQWVRALRAAVDMLRAMPAAEARVRELQRLLGVVGDA